MASYPWEMSSAGGRAGPGGYGAGGPMVAAGPEVYGKRPTVPNLATSANTAIGTDAELLKNLEHIARSINLSNQADALQNIENSVPGYGNLSRQSSANIAQQLSGEVPDDVVNQLIQGAAERGIMGGSPGSPNSSAAYLRALGLTSLGQQEAGQKNLSAAVARTPNVPLFNMAPFLLTPGDQQDTDLTRSIYESAPDPTAAGQYAETLYDRRLREARAYAEEQATKAAAGAQFGSATWGGRPGSGPASAPQWASVAAAPNLTAGTTSFGPWSTAPGPMAPLPLFNSPTFTNGMYTGAAAPAAAPYNPYAYLGGTSAGTPSKPASGSVYYGEDYDEEYW